MEDIKEVYEELKSLIAKDPQLFEKRAKEIVDNHIALAPKKFTASLNFDQASLERAKQTLKEPSKVKGKSSGRKLFFFMSCVARETISKVYLPL